MSKEAILIRYHEIALKGGNRKRFEEKLASNAKKFVQKEIENRTGQTVPVEIVLLHGRVILLAEWDKTTLHAADLGLARCFGISSYSFCRTVPSTLKELSDQAIQEFQLYLQNNELPSSFRVLTRRSEKALSETSMEIDRFVGGNIRELYPSMNVDLDNPAFTLGIELRYNQSYIWTQKKSGPGGLPVGTSGLLLSLISGGIDSPVASIETMKRGTSVAFIHFFGTPFVGQESLNKVEELVKVVNSFQPYPQPLFVIPFGKIQEKIALCTNPKMRTIIYRRMMIRIASRIASRIKAKALVTGESLGQVASQTIDNLITIDDAAVETVIRPLVTRDKNEIIELAIKYGTYTTSIQAASDCCTLFADKHPSIGASINLIGEQESRFSVDDLVNEAISLAERRFL